MILASNTEQHKEKHKTHRKKTKDRETDWRGETETCNPDASGESIWV
jgi:hypothetical protein